MFTGIITDLGRVRAVSGGNKDRRIEIDTAYDTGAIDTGASVCCSGVCLTVTDRGPGWFAASASSETMSRTTIGDWRVGTPVNLERALRAGDELGGHLVFGHVDGMARVSDVTEDGDSLSLVLDAPEGLERFLAAKGSVAIDGVSLTVNDVDGGRFGINVIPHTRANTTLGLLGQGQAVNMEIDMLARYVARLIEKDQP
ncbi:MAG: riboflavin synthase [Proteobacteria bacterium]|nr:riboflavin synthase [Pseudomonadota bacterium]